MRKINKLSGKVGLPPGKVVFVGEQRSEVPEIHIIKFNDKDVMEADVASVAEALRFIDNSTITWINITGLHRVDWIEEFGQALNIHTLLLEDIAHTFQRPKLEEFDDYIFLVFKKIFIKNEAIADDQVSIIFGANYVLTFMETQDPIFQPIYRRINSKTSRINTEKSDYLAYCILDTIIDNYFVVLEILGEKIELLEDEVLLNPSPNILHEIHTLKNNLIALRRAVWPLREVINKFDRTDSELVDNTTKPYIRDIYDHTIHIIDAVENYRDIISGVLDIYLSSLSNRMNEVMKTLTMIATIFIPLSFIAGVYGMNFKYMPELNWQWGYFLVWGIMITVAIFMALFFKNKKWI